MSDYRVNISVKNNNILRMIENMGFKNASEFCRVYEYAYQSLMELINLKALPVDSKGNIRTVVYKLCDILQCEPGELFSDSQMENVVKQNKYSFNVSQNEVQFYLKNKGQDKSLEDLRFEEERDAELINVVNNTLTPRESKILALRFGLNGEDEHTLEQCGNLFGVSGTRIRHIEAKALRKMRHPSRRSFLNE